MSRPDVGEATTRGDLTTGRFGPQLPGPVTGRGPALPQMPHGPVVGPASRPISTSWPAVTSAPPALHLDTHARQGPVPSEPQAVPGSPSPQPRSRHVLPVALGALAGLLLTCLAILLPWQKAAGAPGIAGSAFGIGVLVVSVALIATAVTDLLERRVRWLALVATTPLALLCVVVVAAIAAAGSGGRIAVHLALAGLPWPGPVVSGVGVWLFGAGQAICLVVGLVAVTGWLRGWGDDSEPATPSPRRAVVVALCSLAAVLVLVISGVVLAHSGPRTPAATVAPAAGAGGAR